MKMSWGFPVESFKENTTSSVPGLEYCFMCYSSTLLFGIYYLDSWSTMFAFKISNEVDS